MTEGIFVCIITLVASLIAFMVKRWLDGIEGKIQKHEKILKVIAEKLRDLNTITTKLSTDMATHYRTNDVCDKRCNSINQNIKREIYRINVLEDETGHKITDLRKEINGLKTDNKDEI